MIAEKCARRFSRGAWGACVLHRTEDRLLLIDAGLAKRDYESPAGKQELLKRIFGGVEDPAIAAVHQIRRLGYAPEAVTDILMTRLHFDHAGGLPDFPKAAVHVQARGLRFFPAAHPADHFRG
ncbi:MAG: MBL fold metallo-hydrolase [Anaerolineales bacterium]|nr:MBL fold metallo-hydrolase [Anaerolineales bacterium]